MYVNGGLNKEDETNNAFEPIEQFGLKTRQVSKLKLLISDNRFLADRTDNFSEASVDEY